MGSVNRGNVFGGRTEAVMMQMQRVEPANFLCRQLSHSRISSAFARIPLFTTPSSRPARALQRLNRFACLARLEMAQHTPETAPAPG